MHFTGYGVDEHKNPEQVEHLGITPLEAMAAQCITFCYKAGGPNEIIDSGVNGFLFSSINDLVEKMKYIPDTQSIINNARKLIEKKFSYEVFKNNVKQLIT